MKTKIALTAVLLICLWQAPDTVLCQTPTPTLQAEVKIDAKIFDAYVGQYQNPEFADFIYSFFREGDRFFVRFPNQPKFEIIPLSETKFAVKDSDSQLEFVRSENGLVVSMIWRQNGGERISQKTSDQPAKDTRVTYKRIEAMIPMRDDVKLYTIILTPENQTERLPIILRRTPYGVDEWTSDRVNSVNSDLVKDGYIFAFQDIRGKNKSEGEFVMMRPPRDDRREAKSIDESTDAYDTIDWLVKNLPKNNGRVGIMGVSYPGWLSTVALIDSHPALKAVSPQAPMTDVWLGDDFFHNGAFRQTYAYEFTKSLETSKTNIDVTLNKPDAYEWYFARSPLSKLTDDLGGKIPTWNNLVAHPTYDEFWQKRAAQLYLKDAPLPTLVVGGWWDQEDLFGALATYQALEKYDRKNQVFLVMGPWNHGGWTGRGRKLGDVDFGSDTGKYFRAEIQAPWFAYYLKDKGTLKQAKATIFQSGSNKWKTYNEFPPRRNMQKRNLYLQPNGWLSFEKPKTAKTDDGFDSYVSNPSNPVPFRSRPIDPKSGWSSWLVSDQRFLSDRSDVLKWQTEPLNEDITITGDVTAQIFAATTGTDSDLIVKLIDVYPADHQTNPKMSNYQLMVAGEILRGRFRRSFEKPAPVEPNKVERYAIDLRGNDYVFRKGHRIMVQVQSSWFPLYDRNPQKYVPNIFLAKESDFQTATQRIYRSQQRPSHISFWISTN